MPAQLQEWKLNTIILSRILTTSLHSKCYASAKGWGSKCLIHVSTRCVSLALSKFRLVRVYCKRMRSPTSLGLAGAPV